MSGFYCTICLVTFPTSMARLQQGKEAGSPSGWVRSRNLIGENNRVSFCAEHVQQWQMCVWESETRHSVIPTTFYYGDTCACLRPISRNLCEMGLWTDFCRTENWFCNGECRLRSHNSCLTPRLINIYTWPHCCMQFKFSSSNDFLSRRCGYPILEREALLLKVTLKG